MIECEHNILRYAGFWTVLLDCPNLTALIDCMRNALNNSALYGTFEPAECLKTVARKLAFHALQNVFLQQTIRAGQDPTGKGYKTISRDYVVVSTLK